MNREIQIKGMRIQIVESSPIYFSDIFPHPPLEAGFLIPGINIAIKIMEYKSKGIRLIPGGKTSNA
jgi:hypothetical protein